MAWVIHTRLSEISMNAQAANGVITNACTSETLMNFKAAFEAMPSCSALLATNTPVYTILAATDGFLQLSSDTDNIIGKGLFEAFPRSPDDPNSDIYDIDEYFQKVIATKKIQQFPVQRYDIAGSGGNFSEHYWQSTNRPVLDATGNLLYILHTTENITSKVKAQQREEKMKGMEQAHNLLMQAPLAIGILKGHSLIIELVNENLTNIWGKGTDVKGKPLLEVIPEVRNRGFVELLYDVIETGKPCQAYESPLTFIKDGKEETGYFNFIYQPYYEPDIQNPVGTPVCKRYYRTGDRKKRTGRKSKKPGIGGNP